MIRDRPVGEWFVVAGLVAGTMLAPSRLHAQDPSKPDTPLEAAQRAYYNANYLGAADQALALRTTNPDDFAASELRTAAILFQLKRLIGEDTPDRAAALKNCAACPALIESFRSEILTGRQAAQRRITAAPDDLEATFYLGKLDLNYVWLYLGPLNKRTGWTEYREARRSMESVLKARPNHVRARIAKAWIEYIVDTKVMFGFKWALGGGERKKALSTVQQATKSEAPFFDAVEARFALWEMLAREKRFGEAADVARKLLVDFPDNKELAKFIEKHSARR